MKVTNDISYSAYPEDLLDVYAPDASSDKAFLYFHGGGLEAGDKCQTELMASCLNSKGVTFITANYRMYPSAKCPDFIRDAAAAVAWSIKYAKENLVGKQELYVGGSSAGGYLSMMLCFDPEYLAEVGCSNDDIAGYFHDAGQPTTHFHVLRERGVDTRRVIIDKDAPLYYVGMADSYPKMRFIVSDNDMKGRYEQTMLILSALSHFGYTGYDHVVMENSTHCSYCGKRDSDGESVFAKMIYDFIK
ncbi:MAG: alpha/beta hydrolase [Clostridia bacterium]|nr:alpha/beta hydrolase [Clostridia bacterium]